MSLFSNRIFLAVTLGHFTIDIFNSMGPVLVTFLSGPMALTAAQIGLAVGLYQFLAAVTQPVFGWLTDRLGSRWIGSISVVWTVGWLATAVFLAGQGGAFWWFIIPFSMAALGSGAFHPQGAMHAATVTASQAATATAVFFLFGQGGLAGGPFVAGLLLDHVGVAGVYGLAVFFVPLLLFIAYAMRGADHKTIHRSSPGQTGSTSSQDLRWGALGLLAALIALRSWALLGTVTFLPKLFQDKGWDSTGYGMITGAFWMAGGFTGVMAGSMADRWGRREVTFTTLLLGAIPLYFLPAAEGWLAFLLAILSGGLLGASHSILVVIAQALLPGRQGLASGIILGYIFGVGAVASWGIGTMADTWGLHPVIQAGTGVGIAAALLALLLPVTREVAKLQPKGEAA